MDITHKALYSSYLKGHIVDGLERPAAVWQVLQLSTHPYIDNTVSADQLFSTTNFRVVKTKLCSSVKSPTSVMGCSRAKMPALSVWKRIALYNTHQLPQVSYIWRDEPSALSPRVQTPFSARLPAHPPTLPHVNVTHRWSSFNSFNDDVPLVEYTSMMTHRLSSIFDYDVLLVEYVLVMTYRLSRK